MPRLCVKVFSLLTLIRVDRMGILLLLSEGIAAPVPLAKYSHSTSSVGGKDSPCMCIRVGGSLAINLGSLS